MPILFWLPLIYVAALFEIAATPTKDAPKPIWFEWDANGRVSSPVFAALRDLSALSVASVQGAEERLADRTRLMVFRRNVITWRGRIPSD
jgi:hypothetical protein